MTVDVENKVKKMKILFIARNGVLAVPFYQPITTINLIANILSIIVFNYIINKNK